MNIVDYVIIGIIAISVIYGLYRGFLASMLSTGACAVSFVGSFLLYPRLAALVSGNSDLLRTLLHYTDASSRLGDLTTSVMNVATLTAEKIGEIVSMADLPAPFDTLLQVNLSQKVFASSGLTTVSDYVSQTILNACVNILCYLVCFIGLYLVLTIVLTVVRSVFRLPVLKQLDALAGGALGLLRGLLFVYAVFAVVPLILTMLPIDIVTDVMNESTLAPIFNGSNLILSIMNGRL